MKKKTRFIAVDDMDDSATIQNLNLKFCGGKN